METQQVVPPKLVSHLLAEDPGLRDIVLEFVNGLPTRIADFQKAHEQLDYDLLGTLAHRLKGAAGSYGYPDLSAVCFEMERQFRVHESGAFADWVRQLESLAAAARAGLAQ